MRRTALTLALIAAGCVRTATVTCGDGSVCREGTECIAVADGFVCLNPDEIVCGNGRVEAGETCDDGNVKIGDGCSPDCLSDESCGNSAVDPVVEIDGMLVGNEQCDDGNLVSHDGCSSSCLPETAQWVRREAIPLPRFDTAMTTDDSARRIVLFGGRSDDRGTHYNDTWEWTGGGWSQLRIALAPVPRAGHAMAFDGTRTVLFGGTTGNNATLGDTWLLSGRTWAPHVGQNPPARTDHAMAYMPGVGVVMFGGESLTANDSLAVFGDTWVFGASGWTQLQITSPQPRARHVMVYDPVRNRIVLTGGAANFSAVSGTWEFDGTQWIPHPSASTPSLYNAAAAFDRVRGRVVMHGGGKRETQPQALPSEQEVPTTYEWTGSAWELRDSDLVPGARYGEGASTDPITGRALLFGGAVGLGLDSCPLSGCIGLADTTSTWDGADWHDSGLGKLPPTLAHAATFDPDRRRVIIFGGISGAPGANIYELVEGSWRVITPKAGAPSARIDAAITHAAFPSKRGVFLFGGKAGAVESNETWSFDGVDWTQVTTSTTPPGRSHHAMVFDRERGRIVMFGGQDNSGFRGDMWEYDGTNWMQIAFLPSDVVPAARGDAAMAYDPVNKNVVLFGGDLGAMGVDGNTWTWDGQIWTRHDTALTPPPRRKAGMAWDAARRRIVVFGGGETYGNDAWEWDGSAWSFISIFDPPLARNGHVLVSAPGGDGVLAIGGAGEFIQSLDDVLHLSYLTGSPYEACRADLDQDGDGAAGCTDPDCWATCTPYCELGDPSCLALAPRCGDGVCDPERENCGICADCTCAAQCGDFVCDTGETAATCPGDC